jgi:NAD(P)-dependent dehydrogenase (short-subunit alcohol dehydrogenase family)
MFDTNVKSSFFLANEALPQMEKINKASIMLVSSVAEYLPNFKVKPYKLDCVAY